MKITKKISMMVLIIAMLLTLIPPNAFAENTLGLNNFTVVKTYKANQFSDVPSSAWFSENVKTAYELGLMVGASDTSFNATGNVTIAETIVVACRLHSIYYADNHQFAQGSPWYKDYVDYALQNSIITSEYPNYNKYATRAEFAMILAEALPKDALLAINTVETGTIPDIISSANYYNSVYTLYRAGVLVGNDAIGTFTPDTNIGRNSVAAIVTRLADVSLRKNITLKAIEAKSISLSINLCALKLGETITLKATILPIETTDKSVVWTSSDNSVATVVGGLVTAINGGTAVITAKTANGLEAICTVTIPIEAKSIGIDTQTCSIYIGQTQILSVIFTPNDATDKTIVWKSSNTSVATVNSSGQVYGVSAGNSIITATTAKGLTAQCTVKVSDFARCGEAGCNNPVMSVQYPVSSGYPAYNTKYCEQHGCQIVNCNGRRTGASSYCLSHTCSHAGCLNDMSGAINSYCFDHKCTISGCDNEKKGEYYCYSHQCTVAGCSFGRRDGSLYCGVHKCHNTECTYKALDGFNYCYSHKCTVSSCPSERYLSTRYCYQHRSLN